MPALPNLKHENFCQLMIQGQKHGWSQGEAYQRAGYKARAHSADVLASNLLKNVDVQRRIAELAAPKDVVKRVRATAADLLEKSERVYERAFEIDEMGHANKAVELQGKLGGALIDRIEIGGAGEFAGCSGVKDILDRMIDDEEGGAPALSAKLRQMADDVETRASDRARLIAPR